MVSFLPIGAGLFGISASKYPSMTTDQILAFAGFFVAFLAMLAPEKWFERFPSSRRYCIAVAITFTLWVFGTWKYFLVRRPSWIPFLVGIIVAEASTIVGGLRKRSLNPYHFSPFYNVFVKVTAFDVILRELYCPKHLRKLTGPRGNIDGASEWICPIAKCKTKFAWLTEIDGSMWDAMETDYDSYMAKRGKIVSSSCADISP